MTKVPHSEFDLADPRETGVERMLGSEGLVLWRRDFVWKSGDVNERHVAGVVAGEDGPELFMASAWITWGTELNVRVHARIPLHAAVANRLASTGAAAAQRFHLHPHGDYDNATAALFGPDARYLSRTANTKDAVYLVRSRGETGSVLSIVTSTRHDDGAYSARTEWTEDGGTILEWARGEFGPSLAVKERDDRRTASDGGDSDDDEPPVAAIWP